MNKLTKQKIESLIKEVLSEKKTRKMILAEPGKFIVKEGKSLFSLQRLDETITKKLPSICLLIESFKENRKTAKRKAKNDLKDCHIFQ